MISERIKFNNNQSINKNIYFWRTTTNKEIDYLEELNGKLTAFEFKWQKDKLKKPKAFLEAYPQAEISLVNQKNYKNFVSGD